MAKFQDKTGRTWSIEFDVGLLEMIRKETGVDFDDMTGDEAGRTAFADMLIGGRGKKLVEVLWVMCEEQAAKEAITPEEFGRLFTARVLQDSSFALMEALADFSPRQAISATIKRRLPDLFNKMDKTAVAAMELEFDRLLESDLSKPATKLLAPSESTPGG